MPFTYIVECNDGSYYTGWTLDLEKRVEKHNAGKGAKYTRSHRPVRLVYHEHFDKAHQAQTRERQIKKLSHKEKEELCCSYLAKVRHCDHGA